MRAYRNSERKVKAPTYQQLIQHTMLTFYMAIAIGAVTKEIEKLKYRMGASISDIDYRGILERYNEDWEERNIDRGRD